MKSNGRRAEENKTRDGLSPRRKRMLIGVCIGTQAILAELIWAEIHRQPVPLWCVFAGIALFITACVTIWEPDRVPIPSGSLPENRLSLITPETICRVMRAERIASGIEKRRMSPAGERLFQLRKKRKLTLQQAAEKWGISLGALDRYELGHELLKSDKAVRIARIEGVSLDWLFALDVPERSEK